MTCYYSTGKSKYMNEGERKNMAIVVDGIIGAGKSTVAHFLSKELGIRLYEELEDSNKNSLAQRMLDRFYADQTRWSAIIQVMFLNDRFRDIKAIEANEEPAIIDRSIYGDEIFARTIHHRGQMETDEFVIYRDLLHNMLEHVKPPEVLVYIDVNIDTAMERISNRNRSTEADLIPRDYMEDLRRHYEEWYDEYDLSPKVKIDLNDSCANENGELSDEVKAQIMKAIKPYIAMNMSFA
jgi:deoxyadenosine/deoxycytidine kinase